MRLASSILAIVLAACGAASLPAVRDGDIVFQTSRSAQSLAIQKATHSPYSHVGVVFFRGGRPCVLEAVATVRCTPLAGWIDRGLGGHYVIKRLRDADRLLTRRAISRLSEAASSYEGLPYDITFQWSDDQLYCSELVWKLYHSALGIDIGRLQRLGQFDLSDPGVAAKLLERYGGQIPLDEPVVSPAAIFESEKLVTVAER